MKVSSVQNTFNSFPKNNLKKTQNKQNVSFGSIYVENNVELGRTAESRFPPKFSTRDALLFNEIAQLYPNQDCFIRRGPSNYPRLEFREKPVDVQVFNATLGERYRTEVNPADEDNPCVELLLDNEDRIANKIIGVQNYIATNPSLAFTVMAGFEVHKKLLEKKFQIMEYVGYGDDFDVGKSTVDEIAHQSIKDVELAVKRYLLECACATLKDRASASQIYASNLPKVQSRLGENRKKDLTTSIAKHVPVTDEELTKGRIDICEVAMATYPNTDENKKRIELLERFMINNSLAFS